MKEKIKLIIDIRPIVGVMKKYHYFYRIRNKITGKEYYGIHSTKNLNDGYSGSGKLLKKAILKYGIDNFYMQILKFFEDRKSCSEYEKKIVSPEYLKDFNGRTYNLVGGGDNGHFISDTVKQKISQSEKGKKVSRQTRQKISIALINNIPWNKDLLGENNPQFGRKHTAETKKNISIALQEYYKNNNSSLKGKKRSERFRASVSAGKTGVKFTNEHRAHLSESHIGLHHTEITKDKIRKSLRENPHGFIFPKNILCIDLNIIFKSIKDAWLSLKDTYNFPNYQNFCKKVRNNVKIDGLSFKIIGGKHGKCH